MKLKMVCFPDRKKLGRLFLVILILFVLINPAYLAQIPILDELLDILKVFVSIIIVSYELMLQRKIDKFIIIVIIMDTCLLSSTILNGGNILEWIRAVAYGIVFAFFVKIMIERDAETLLKAASILFGLYIHINTACFFIFPDGMYTDSVGWTTNYFLGLDNVSGLIALLAMMIAMFRISINMNKNRPMIWDKTIIVNGMLYPFIRGMGTMMICTVLFFALNIAYRKMALIRSTLNARTIVVIGTLAFFAIQFFGVQYLFSNVFELVGKEATLSHRTIIWTTAWDNLREANSFLWGFGVTSVENLARQLDRWWAGQLHSYYFQMLYFGGIVSFVAYFALQWIAASRFDHDSKTMESYIFLSGLMVLVCIMQVEAYNSLNVLMVFFLSLIYRNKQLTEFARSKANR